MNTNDIQKHIDTLPAKLSAKGIVKPDVRFQIRANASPEVSATWYTGTHYSNFKMKTCRGDTPADALTAADEWIASLPTAEQAKLEQFMSALGDVIDMGRQNGIEVAFVNPLVETMKRLSENVLTDQRAA